MKFELPASGPAKLSRAAARRAEIRAGFYQAAKPTSLSPIALGSSTPGFLREIAVHDQLTARVDNRLRVLEQMPVGVGLAAELTALSGVQLGCDGAVRATVLWQKLGAWTAAQAMVTTREALESWDPRLTSEQLRVPVLVGQELACASRVALATAMAQVNLTTQVADTLPRSWVALDRGQWSLAHVRALAGVTQNATPRAAGQVEDRIVPAAVARGSNPSQVKKNASKVLAAVDPDGAARRAKQAKAGADVTFTPLPDETATVTGYGDAATTRRVFDTINAAAAAMRRDGDDRSVGLRRFDALANAVLGEGADRPAAQALIAIPAGTLAGGDQPGDLAGYGPISAATARELATDAIWRKLICDPGTGEALDIGMRAYRPSEALIRFVKSRDWTCRAPGCNQPAIACDCDHRIDHHDDGPTSRWNLQLLCRLHHNVKTCKLWTSLLDPATGEVEWTSPLGHTYTVEPHRLLDLLNEPPDEPDQPAIPIQAVDEPDPPWPDEPPPITADQLEEYLDAIDQYQQDEWVRANTSYDRYRQLGLIA